MPRAIEDLSDFTIIAENIHATRVLLRKGKRVTTLEDGTEVVPFTGESGEQLYLRVPESFKDSQPYQQGQIKHFMIAAMKGIGDDPDEQKEGAAYVHYEVRRQTDAGATFLDLNVDEVSPNLDVEKEDGTVESWMIEAGPPGALVRRGWSRESVIPGTEVLVEGYQAIDGAFRANGRDVTFPDGRRLFAGSSGTGAPLDGRDPTEPRR